MKFAQKSGYVFFHDDRPGQHATLFGPSGEKLPFAGEASSFDDANRRYAWAFTGTVPPDGRLVFATADREVVGTLQSEAKDAKLGEWVWRIGDGKPARLALPAHQPRLWNAGGRLATGDEPPPVLARFG